MKRSAPALLWFLFAFALTLATGPNTPRLLCRDTGVVFAEPLIGEGHCVCCPGEGTSTIFPLAGGEQAASENKSTFTNEPCCAVVQQDTKLVAPVVVPFIDAPAYAAFAPAPFTACPTFLVPSTPSAAFRPAAPRAPPLRCAPSRAPPCLV